MPDECANPLLLGWVKEWLDAAKEENSKAVFTYKKAHDSIKACPIAFEHPSQAQELRGVGPKLCERLTQKLQAHCEQHGLPMPDDPRAKNNKRSADAQIAPAPESTEANGSAPRPAKRPRKTKPKIYVPALRSGAYAIVLALSTLPENSDSGMTKNQIISIAEAHCNSSFVAPSDPTKTYTAWSSMRTLQDKDLVFITGGASKRYALTDDGWDVARKMRDAANLNTQRILEPLGELDAASLNPFTLARPQSRETVSPEKATESPPRHQIPRRTFLDFSDSENEPTLDMGGRCTSSQPEPTLPKPRSKAALERAYTDTNFVDLVSSSPHLQPTKPTRLNRQEASRPDAAPSSFPSPQKPSNDSQRLAGHNVTTTTKESVQSGFPAGCRTIQLPPSSYTIEILLDNREVRSKTDRTYLQDGLLSHGIRPTTRALELGDCTWVARVHDPQVLQALGVRPAVASATSLPTTTTTPTDPSCEFVLDHVVERKRLDDLIASLKDGRYHEQKFRLRRSGVKNVTYLIEEVSLSTEVAQRWHGGVRSALASTLVVDKFHIVRTKRLDDSIRWLARTTRALRRHYADQTLTVITEHSLDVLEDGARTRKEADARLAAFRVHVGQQQQQQDSNVGSIARTVFLSYPAFAARAAKQDGLALRDVFLKMLLCTRGISADKALAVQRQWPTPHALIQAYRDAGADPAARANLLLRATAHLTGRQKIGKAVSARVAEVWGSLESQTGAAVGV